VRRARPKLDRALLEGQGRGTAARRTLHALLRGARGPLPLEQALSFALDIAEDLADDEARGPSQAAPLTPDDVIVVDDRAAFAPEFAPTKAELAPVWCPPPQVDGAPFDHQANRYVLGLLLYKMLTGSHPFGGMGLREMLEAARSSEPPPFKQEQATALPPGLQSLVLKLLSQDPAARPSSAAEVADALHGFSGRAGLADAGPRGGGPPAALFAHDTLPSSGVARDAVLREAAERRAAAPAARLEAPPGLVAAPPPKRPAPSAKGWVAALLPLALGAAVAAAAVTQLKPPDATPQPKASVGAMKAIGPGELTAEDCASCHARQASEWRRSVMGHAVKSPLFNALEALVQEQIGRDNDCPNGAGALRKTTAELACRNPQTGVAISGSGGEHWCVNCHAPSEVQENLMPPWDGRGRGNPRANFPVKDLIGERAKEGISCGFCHQVHGPVSPRSRSAYQGNPTWTSFVTGAVFESRPEDRAGLFGISNSGYEMRLGSFVLGGKPLEEGPDGSALVHARPDDAQRKYLRSSEFCGACHDVRLFGSDAINAPAKGEHFKRLRNAYSEWRDWARLEERKGKTAATCIDCHMSEYPGACEPDPGGAGDDLCPEGTRWVKRAPGTFPKGRVASSSQELTPITTHYLSGVDLPLSHDYPKELLDESSLDLAGIPISAKKRRDALLKAAFDFDLGTLSLKGDRLLVPVEIENIGGGHKIPAGFSQEREIWVHLTVKDGQGRTLYEVGRVDRPDEDLRDKIFDRVNTDPTLVDLQGRPLGLFGADVRDGPDHPEWSPPPETGASRYVGKGLINFQNGFLRCVTCIGTIASDGSCQPLPGQERHRAARFDDGGYDLDTGACTSNLSGSRALFETYFPVGGLDASRGVPKAPDAIIDTRSLPPNVRQSFTYDLAVGRAKGPITVRARLLFRAFPPFLLRAFAAYEAAMSRLGRRPSGPLLDLQMLERLEITEIAKVERSAGSP
jgi:hypothetical protein